MGAQRLVVSPPVGGVYQVQCVEVGHQQAAGVRREGAKAAGNRVANSPAGRYVPQNGGIHRA
jgi:hypothetical protein